MYHPTAGLLRVYEEKSVDSHERSVSGLADGIGHSIKVLILLNVKSSLKAVIRKKTIFGVLSIGVLEKLMSFIVGDCGPFGYSFVDPYSLLNNPFKRDWRSILGGMDKHFAF